MKQVIIILFLAVVGCNGVFAQSMLKVSLTDQSVINVEVDSRYFNKSGTSVTVGDLPPGNHYLQIYTIVQDRRGRGRQQQVYEGKVKTYNGMITLFSYDADSGVDMQEQDINNYVADHPLPQYTPNDGNNTPAESPAPIATSTLTDSKTNDLKAHIDAKKTDTEKMNLLKDALKNEKITTAQVSGMVDWFNFDDTRINFIEWAYSITVDPENYGTLDNKFSFKNYQADFEKWYNDKK